MGPASPLLDKLFTALDSKYYNSCKQAGEALELSFGLEETNPFQAFQTALIAAKKSPDRDVQNICVSQAERSFKTHVRSLSLGPAVPVPSSDMADLNRLAAKQTVPTPSLNPLSLIRSFERQFVFGKQDFSI